MPKRPVEIVSLRWRSDADRRGVCSVAYGVGAVAKRTGSQLGYVLGMGVGVAAMPVESMAGAWTLDAGTGQAVIVGTVSSSDQIFDAARNIQSVPRYGKFELTSLIEYGATNWLTLMLLPQLQHIDIAS